MKHIKPALLLLFIGFVIVALPDNGVRLFSWSEKHGPSVQDAIGLLLLLAAEGMLLWDTWRQRKRVIKHFSPGGLFTGTTLFCTGLALTIAAVLHDAGLWWVPGILLMVFVQAFVFYIALK